MSLKLLCCSSFSYGSQISLCDATYLHEAAGVLFLAFYSVADINNKHGTREEQDFGHLSAGL
jgi:hypothetical protein